MDSKASVSYTKKLLSFLNQDYFLISKHAQEYIGRRIPPARSEQECEERSRPCTPFALSALSEGDMRPAVSLKDHSLALRLSCLTSNRATLQRYEGMYSCCQSAMAVGMMTPGREVKRLRLVDSERSTSMIIIHHHAKALGISAKLLQTL